MGLLGTVSAVGTALGPSLGGVLINAFGWPAVFVFMAVASTSAFAFGHKVFPVDAVRDRKSLGFDLPGMLLLALSLVFRTWHKVPAGRRVSDTGPVSLNETVS